MHFIVSPSNWSTVETALFTAWRSSEKVTWFQIIFMFAPISTTQGIISARSLFFTLFTEVSSAEAAQQFRENSIVVLLCTSSSSYLYRDVEITCMHVPIRLYTGWISIFYAWSQLLTDDIFYRAVPLGSNMDVSIICASSQPRERYQQIQWPAHFLFFIEVVRNAAAAKPMIFSNIFSLHRDRARGNQAEYAVAL